MKAFRKLDFAERWMHDGIRASWLPAYFECIQVDMSEARWLIDEALRRGQRLTYTHIFVRAAARALAANSDLHLMVCGGKVYQPGQVDIALSVASDTAVAPLLVLESADRKHLIELASEIVRRAPEARGSNQKMMGALRKWGWLAPSGKIRRRVLELLFRNAAFRRKGSGTFQVSVLTNVDLAMSPVFSSTAMLVAGEVKDRVIAVQGVPVVRPTVYLTCCADHRVWDGRAGQRFLASLRELLESRALFEELEPIASEGAPKPASKDSLSTLLFGSGKLN